MPPEGCPRTIVCTAHPLMRCAELLPKPVGTRIETFHFCAWSLKAPCEVRGLKAVLDETRSVAVLLERPRDVGLDAFKSLFTLRIERSFPNLTTDRSL